MLVIHSKEEKESWREGYQVLGWEWGMVLDWMISKGLTEKVTFGKDLKEVREPAMLILGGEHSRQREQSMHRSWGGSMSGVFEEWQGGQWGLSGMKESRRECSWRGEMGLDHGGPCRSQWVLWFLPWWNGEAPEWFWMSWPNSCFHRVIADVMSSIDWRGGKGWSWKTKGG